MQLYLWLRSQLDYSKILNSVEPLQNEMKKLEGEADGLKDRQRALNDLATDLEKRIDDLTVRTARAAAATHAPHAMRRRSTVTCRPTPAASRPTWTTCTARSSDRSS